MGLLDKANELKGKVKSKLAGDKAAEEPHAFEKEVVDEHRVGRADECIGTVIEEAPGFSISGLVSRGESFFGVNLTKSDSAWDRFHIGFEIEVWGYDDNGCEEWIGRDKRTMSVETLREAGSLGTFYPDCKGALVNTEHKCRLKVTVQEAPLENFGGG
eukprot:TRINITY_DN2459_c0_g3_i1.p1 TRINITY_DN2459_c0_g3~~TRINITY_DN2459_c0_g3_i1.p1  ORF type:complete len:176 (+),score=68.91 TRINITY_DN2459_c0_g3_i1:55-528(+)